MSTSVTDPRSVWAWRSEVVVERFHASIMRRLAEKALEAGEPAGDGDVWRAAGGDAGNWLELDDLLRTLRAHREVTECQLLARPETDAPRRAARGEPPVDMSQRHPRDG